MNPTYTEIVYRDGSGRARTLVLTHGHETADQQRERLAKRLPRTDDDEWDTLDSGVVRVVRRGRVTLIGPAQLVVVRDDLESLDDVQSVIVDPDGTMYEKVEDTEMGSPKRTYIKGHQVE